jgi:hypothetical protein
VQSWIDPGIPLLARFYPLAERRELARLIEIVSLIVRTVAPRVAEEPEEIKCELFISEISSGFRLRNRGIGRSQLGRRGGQKGRAFYAERAGCAPRIRDER